MFRAKLLSMGVRGAQSQRLCVASPFAAFSSTASQDDVKKFIGDVLAAKKFSKQEVDSELGRLDKGNIKTMELLRNLSMRDWENLGVTVGAARAIQDALWEQRHSELLQKTENKMKLRRENSSKQESKQKRL